MYAKGLLLRSMSATLNMTKLLLLTASCLAGISSWAQSSILEYFTALQIDNHVQIDFAIVGGASCNGVQLLRSSDGENFYFLEEIEGVCGGSEFTEQFTLIDDAPLQTTANHYKLILGTVESSEVLTYHFVALEAGYRVIPNPIRDWAVIRFDNPTGLVFELAVFDMSGALVESGSNITSSEIHLQLTKYRPGMYIFQLLSVDGTRITGRFNKL